MTTEQSTTTTMAYRCNGCGHLYEDANVSCDCMTYGSKPMQYTEYVVMPKSTVQLSAQTADPAGYIGIAPSGDRCAFLCGEDDTHISHMRDVGYKIVPLFTHPAKTGQPASKKSLLTEQPSLSDDQIEEIASWLDEASSDVESWGAYASDYFQDKWDLTGAVQFYKTCAAAVRGMTAQRQDSDKDKFAALERRYLWAVNELLACDYGDNDQRQVGWIVYGWRDKSGKRRLYGDDVDIAIDAAIANGAPK